MAAELVERLYGLRVKTIKELSSYDDKNFLVTVSDSWDNKNIEEIWPHGYVFKILNSADSMSSNHVEAEHDMMVLLYKEGFSCPRPVRNIHGETASNEINPLGEEGSNKVTAPVETGREPTQNGSDCRTKYHTCRLLTYLPGEVLHSVPYTESLMYQAGEYVARMEESLQNYHHKSLIDNDIMWRLEKVPDLRRYIHVIGENDRRTLALDVIETFEKEVLTRYDQLTKGIIHGDFNDHNIIVSGRPDVNGDTSSNLGHHITGVIDFGDSSYSCYVFEIAIAMMYLSLESAAIDPLMAGGHVLRGYQSIRSLTHVERNVLKYCVAARYVQSVILGEYSHSKDPDNAYLLVTIDKGWPQLRRLWNTPIDELYRLWGI